MSNFIMTTMEDYEKIEKIGEGKFSAYRKHKFPVYMYVCWPESVRTYISHESKTYVFK